MSGDSVLGYGGDLFVSDGIDDAQIVAVLIGDEQRRVRGGHLGEGSGARDNEQKER